MNVPSPFLPAAPPRSPRAASRLLGLALALAGCVASAGCGAPPAGIKVPEVPIAPALGAPQVTRVEPDRAPPPPSAPKVDTLLGRSKEQAIDVCGPPGQRAYLRSLRCGDGQVPTFDRAGNVGSRNPRSGSVPESVVLEQMDPSRPLGKGEVDYHIVDRYKVVCSDGEHSLYMDMYHCAGPQTGVPPSGFTMPIPGGV